MTLLGYLFRHHVALIALAVALSGTAYAASKIGPGDIAKNAVRGQHVKNKSLGPQELKRQPKWRLVRRNPPGLPHPDPCPEKTAVFCGFAESSANSWFWENYGSPFARAGFYRDSIGTVHLKGLVKTQYLGGLPTWIFRLPPGFRPAERLIFGGQRNGASTRIDVLPDGIVHWDWNGTESVPPAFLSLDQISFRAR